MVVHSLAVPLCQPGKADVLYVRLSSLTRARPRFSQDEKRPPAHAAFTVAHSLDLPLCQPGKADVLYVGLSSLTRARPRFSQLWETSVGACSVHRSSFP